MAGFTSAATGFFSDQDDDDAFAANLALALGDRELARRLGRAGREVVACRFPARATADSFEAAYRRVLGMPAGSTEPGRGSGRPGAAPRSVVTGATAAATPHPAADRAPTQPQEGMNMRALVTGGAGYIGSHLVDVLLAEGFDVSVVDNLSTGKIANIEHCLDRIRFVNGSIMDEHLIEQLVADTDLVFHLAAAVGVKHIVDRPLQSLLTNARGTEIVLEKAFKYWRRVLVASTSEVYGKTSKVPMVEDDDRVLGSTKVHRWGYSTAKALDEHLAFAYADQGLPVSMVRYFNSYGPRLDPAGYGSVVANFLGRALRGEPLVVYGRGEQTRCFTYVSDTVRGTFLAGTSPTAVGTVVNIGNPTRDHRDGPGRADPHARRLGVRPSSWSTTSATSGPPSRTPPDGCPTSPGPASCSAGPPRCPSRRAWAARSSGGSRRTEPVQIYPANRAPNGPRSGGVLLVGASTGRTENDERLLAAVGTTGPHRGGRRPGLRGPAPRDRLRRGRLPDGRLRRRRRTGRRP